MSQPEPTPDQNNEALKKDLQQEKLKAEIALLERQLKNRLEEKAHENETERQRKDYRRSVMGFSLTAFSVLVSALISYYSITKTTQVTSEKIKIDNDNFWLDQLKRIDQLRADFDDSKTSTRRRVAIAYELAHFQGEETMTPDEKAFFQTFYTENNAIFHKPDTISKQLEAKDDNIKNDETKMTFFKKAGEIEFELENAQTEPEREKAQERFDSLKSEIRDPELTETLVLLDSLSNTQVDAVRLQEETGIATPVASWFKKGYYRQFFEHEIRIGLSELKTNKKIGRAKISFPDAQGKFIPKTTLDFLVPSRKVIKHQGVTYEINFNKIDRAGKNPLTKAVYFSVVKTPTD